jgi:hypothetical protein
MPIEISALADLDQALVDQERAVLTTMIQEQWPSIDFRRGVLSDTIGQIHAVLAAMQRTNVNRYLSARSLKDIQADPTLADTGVVDSLLSNWRLLRNPGGTALGYVTLVLNAPNAVTLSGGTVFQASNGLQFKTTQLFAAVASAALVRDQYDVLITPGANGTWLFTVQVQAVAIGGSYNVPKDTLVLPLTQPGSLITAYASSDFTGGADVETNDAMLLRLQQGFAAKGAGNRIILAAYLRSLPAFQLVQDMSVIGYGDPEMHRDCHSIMPIKYGGRKDWYLRSQLNLAHWLLTKTATLVQIDNDGYGIWQFPVAKEDAPGFYEIRNIRLPGMTNVVGGFEILSDIRGLDFTQPGFIPDIVGQEEGAYSAFQTATIQFRDTLTKTANLAIGTRQAYVAEAVGMPLIATLQALVAGRDNRMDDYLIKAPVPCFVQVGLTVYKRADEPDPDIVGIQQALANVVNGTGFIGRLYASQLTDAASTFLKNTTSMGKLDIFGRIRRPDDSTLYLRDGNVLKVTDDPARMVTASTVAFYLDPADVAVSIEIGIPMPL